MGQNFCYFIVHSLPSIALRLNRSCYLHIFFTLFLPFVAAGSTFLPFASRSYPTRIRMVCVWWMTGEPNDATWNNDTKTTLLLLLLLLLLSRYALFHFFITCIPFVSMTTPLRFNSIPFHLNYNSIFIFYSVLWCFLYEKFVFWK